MKNISQILLFIILFLCISCKKNTGQKTDEAETKKLESLRIACTSDHFSPAGLKNSKILKKEAEKANNELYIGYAYNYMMLYYLNNEKKDSALYSGQKAKEYFTKAGNSDLLLKTENSLIEWEVNYGDPETALKKANVFLKDTQKSTNKLDEFYAYKLLGNIHSILGNSSQAMDSFDKMLETKNNNNLNLGPNSAFIFLEVANAAEGIEKYNLSLQYCDSAQYYINKYPDSPHTPVLNILLYLNQGNNFIKLNRMKEAKQTLEKLSSYYPSTDSTKPKDKFYYYIQVLQADYFFENKQYDTALQKINIALNQFEKVSDKHNSLLAERKKASILEALGKYKEAYELTNKINSYTDSLSRQKTIKQLNTIHNLYEKERIQYETDNTNLQIKYNNNIILFFTIILILLLIIVGIFIYNHSKLKKKNEKIFAHFNELDKYLSQISNLSDQVKNKQKPEEPSLFEKINSYLTESEYFCDPSISRESLASKLGTNRQYLTQAIQDNTGKTFMEYIYDMRLEYARRLLSYHQDLAINEIYSMAGFNSKSNFYRLFKQKYDITPKELQDIAIQNSKNNK